MQEEKKKLELETEVQKNALKGQSEDAVEKEMLLKAEIEKRELLLAALEQNAGECRTHFCSLDCLNGCFQGIYQRTPTVVISMKKIITGTESWQLCMRRN